MTGRRLAIILGVIMILGAAYGTHVIQREKHRAAGRRAVLHDHLATMRKAIDNFYAAEKRYPKSLQELVPKYIRTIPKDPITGSDTTWRVTTEETVQPNNDFVSGAAAPKTEKYIVDVHSGASGKDANGVRFADY